MSGAKYRLIVQASMWQSNEEMVRIHYCAITRSSVQLNHWGRVTHICVGNLTSVGSDNGLSPWRRQAITWTNAGLLLIGPLGTNFSEILFGIQTFSFKKMHFKMSSAKWRPFCFGINVLRSSDAVRALCSLISYHVARLQQRVCAKRGHRCLDSVYIESGMWS